MGRKHSGFASVSVTMTTLFLAAIGAWYLHRAYTQGNLKNDLKTLAADGQKVVASHLPASQANQNPFSVGPISKISQIIIDQNFRRDPIQDKSPMPASISKPVGGAYYE